MPGSCKGNVVKSSNNHPAESWRIVLFTNITGGITWTFINDAVRPLGHRIVGVVTTPGPKSNRSTDYLDVVAVVPPGIDTIVANHPTRLAAMVSPLRPDPIIVAGFSWLIPADLIALPRLGVINLHPSRLPEHRGPNPIEWALRNGQAETSFTIHRLGDDFDNGPVLAQRSVPIDDDDDGDSLIHKLTGEVPELMRTALARVAAGDAGDAQDEAGATYAGPFEPAWREIDWTHPARLIHNQVRSWTGFRRVPRGALATIDGERVVVVRTRLLDPYPGVTAAPGTVLGRDGERLLVQCGDGPLEILAIERVAEPAAVAG
jgi:methionyl-tRNA formyltransferase